MEFTAVNAAPVAIALVDASGSTKDTFSASLTIFNKFRDVLKTLNHEHFYIQFWSSANALGSSTGTLKFPFKVEKAQLAQPFSVCATKEFGSTFPHLGFVGIDDWLRSGVHTVYLLTDGAMSDPSSPDFKNAVSKLMRDFPDVQLHLITVEPRSVDFQNMENMQGVVGGDVYKILVNSRMTHLLSSFTSYTRNHENGYKHLERIRAPPGCLSFRNQLFKETDLPKFFEEAQRLVSELDPNNEEKLLQLLQDLVTPVARAQRDKPAGMVRAMTANFASLFDKTCINPQIATFLLSSGCTADNAGQVQVLADFRRQLKDAFRSAQLMLCASVSNATGLGDAWMSLPMTCSGANQTESLVIVTGPTHVLNKEIQLQGSTYQQGVAQVGDTLVGAIPMVMGELAPSANPVTGAGVDNLVTGGLTEQCTRQWVRSLASQTYGVNATSDIVVYLIMALNAQVAASPTVDDAVKKAWQNLAKIMLRKKRVNSTETEWDRLERGEVPLPNNGSLDSLRQDLATVTRLLNAKFDPSDSTAWQHTWRALCEPLGLTAQFRHCTVDGAAATKITWPDITQVYKLPMDDLDYTCGVTMESTAQTGGFKLWPHTSRSGYNCSPRLVFSAEGKDALLTAGVAQVCPICFAQISDNSFTPVGPALVATGEVDAPTFKGNPLAARAVPALSQSTGQNYSSGNGGYNNNNSGNRGRNNNGPTVPLTNGTKGIIMLKGTVGCGKSTFAAKIKEALAAAGKTSVCILNVDKHTASGMSFPNAIAATTREAQEAANNGTEYIIVDTCFSKPDNLFGVDARGKPSCTISVNYDGKSQNLRSLLAWSWRNILRRTGAGTNAEGVSHSLCIAACGRQKCWEVLDGKARVAYGKKCVQEALKGFPQNECAELDTLADEYEKIVSGMLNKQISYVMSKF